MLLFDQISDKNKQRFISEILTIQEIEHLLYFRDDDEKFQEEFMRLWKKYNDIEIIRSFEDKD